MLLKFEIEDKDARGSFRQFPIKRIFLRISL